MLLQAPALQNRKEMNTEFRTLLIKLFNQLSDTDRRALYFLLETKIPESYRNQCTPEGSLRLLDYLFDHNLIAEQNIDYLIHLFQQISSRNVVAELKEYQLHAARKSMAECSADMKSFPSKWECDLDDRLQIGNKTKGQMLQLPSSSYPGSSVEVNGCMVPSSIITSPERTHILDGLEKKRLPSTIQKIFNGKQYFLPTILILTLTFSILFSLTLLCFLRLRTPKVNHSSFHPFIRREMFYVMKEGLQYGNADPLPNESFNDAKDHQLTYTDRCIGVELRWTVLSLISIRFLYTNNRSAGGFMNKSRNLSSISSEYSSSFMLNSGEEINKINVYQNLSERNSSIVGIQFRTTEGRKSDVFGSNDEQFFTESFEFYTFAYARGRQTLNKEVQMLQFIWSKQAAAKEQIITVPRPMVEICHFSFYHNRTFELIRVKGIESSWHNLKQEFNRKDGGLNFTASYYKTISEKGPALFAIVNHTSAFYHDKGRWKQYISAKDIECDMIPGSELNFFG